MRFTDLLNMYKDSYAEYEEIEHKLKLRDRIAISLIYKEWYPTINSNHFSTVEHDSLSFYDYCYIVRKLKRYREDLIIKLVTDKVDFITGELFYHSLVIFRKDV